MAHASSRAAEALKRIAESYAVESDIRTLPPAERLLRHCDDGHIEINNNAASGIAAECRVADYAASQRIARRVSVVRCCRRGITC